MDNVKVSIILPVHNSKPYLAQCIESAINQTLKEIEIICVCGSGNDGSDILVEEYQKKDNRIVKIDDANGSYGHKLNVGTMASRGEYVAILETDDYIENNMLEELFVVAGREKVDYVDADYYEFFEQEDSEYKIIHNKYMDRSVYGKKLYEKDTRMSIILSDITANWTAIYNREFLMKNSLFYHESPGASYQDLGFRYLLACTAQTSFHLHESLYNYRTDNASSSVKDMKKIFVVQGEYQYIFNQMKKRNISQQYLWDYYYIWKYRDYFWNAQRLEKDGRKQFLEVYRNELLYDKEAGKINDEIVSERYINCVEKPLCEASEFNDILDSVFVTTAKKMEQLMYIARKCRDKEIVICGCGVRGKNISTLLKRENILCMCDENKELIGKHIDNNLIISYEEATKQYKNAIFIIANRFQAQEIAKKLETLQIKKEQMVLYD